MMASERIVSNVFGIKVDTVAFLKQWRLLDQNLEDLEAGVNRFLDKCGFSSNPPKTLYRYRSPKHMVDEIANRYIHYSSVTSMSDPYDCLFSSRRTYKNIGVLDENSQDYFDDVSERMLSDSIREEINVCCFSTDCTSFSMWDQYASGHGGVCIEYDSRKLQKHNVKPRTVKYSVKSFKRFNGQAKDVAEYLVGHLSGCVLTKNRDYRHEQEWRSFGTGASKVQIEDAINCVYIGSRCSKGRNKVIQTCRDLGIDYVRMSVPNDEYSFVQRRHSVDHNL